MAERPDFPPRGAILLLVFVLLGFASGRPVCECENERPWHMSPNYGPYVAEKGHTPFSRHSPHYFDVDGHPPLAPNYHFPGWHNGEFSLRHKTPGSILENPSEPDVVLPCGEKVPYALYESCIECYKKKLPLKIVTSAGDVIPVSSYTELLLATKGNPEIRIQLPNGVIVSSGTYRALISGYVDKTLEVQYPKENEYHSPATRTIVADKKVREPTVIMPSGERLSYKIYESIVRSNEERSPLRVLTPTEEKVVRGLTELILATQGRPFDLVLLNNGAIVTSKVFRDAINSRLKKNAVLILPSGLSMPLNSETLIPADELPSGETPNDHTGVLLPNGEDISLKVYESILNSEINKLPKCIIKPSGEMIVVTTLAEIMQVTEDGPYDVIELNHGVVITPGTYESAVRLSAEEEEINASQEIFEPSSESDPDREVSVVLHGGLELPYDVYEAIMDTYIHGDRFIVTVSGKSVAVGNLLELIAVTHGNPDDVITLPNGMHITSSTFRGVINEHQQNDIFLRMPSGEMIPLSKGYDDYIHAVHMNRDHDCNSSPKEGFVTVGSGEKIAFPLYETIISSSCNGKPIYVVDLDGGVLMIRTLPELWQLVDRHPEYLIRLPGDILVPADTYRQAVHSRQENAEILAVVCGTNGIRSLSDSSSKNSVVVLSDQETIPYHLYKSIINSYESRTPLKTTTSQAQYVYVYPLVELMLVTKHRPNALVFLQNGDVTTAHTYRDAVTTHTQGKGMLLNPPEPAEPEHPVMRGQPGHDRCNFVRMTVPGRGVQFILGDGCWDSPKYCRVECGEGKVRYQPADQSLGLPCYESLVRPDGKVVYVEAPCPQTPQSSAQEDESVEELEPASKQQSSEFSELTSEPNLDEADTEQTEVIEGGDNLNSELKNRPVFIYEPSSIATFEEPPCQDENEEPNEEPKQLEVIDGYGKLHYVDIGNQPVSITKSPSFVTYGDTPSYDPYSLSENQEEPTEKQSPQPEIIPLESTEPCEDVADPSVNPFEATPKDTSKSPERVPETITKFSEENPVPLFEPSEIVTGDVSEHSEDGHPASFEPYEIISEHLSEPREDIPEPVTEASEPCEEIPEPDEPSEDIPEPVTELDVENPVPSTETSEPCKDTPELVTGPSEPCEDISEIVTEPYEEYQMQSTEVSEPSEDIPEPLTAPAEACEDIHEPDVGNPAPSIEPSEPCEDTPELVIEPYDDYPVPSTEPSEPPKNNSESITEPDVENLKPTTEPSEPCEDFLEPVPELTEPCEDIPEPDGENKVPPTEPSEPSQDILEPVTEPSESRENVPNLVTGPFEEYSVPSAEPSETIEDIKEPVTDPSEICEDIPELVTEANEENSVPSTELSEPSEEIHVPLTEPHVENSNPTTEPSEPCEDIPEIGTEPYEEYQMQSTELSKPSEDTPELVTEPSQFCEDIPETVTQLNEEYPVSSTELSETCGDIPEPVSEPSEPREDIPEPVAEPSESCGDIPDLVTGPFEEYAAPSTELSEPSVDINEPETDPSELCEDIPELITEPNVEYPVPSTELSEPSEEIRLPVSEPDVENSNPTTETSEPCEDFLEPVTDLTEPCEDIPVTRIEPDVENPVHSTEPSVLCEDIPEPVTVPSEPCDDVTEPVTEPSEPCEDMPEVVTEPYEENPKSSTVPSETSEDTDEPLTEPAELSVDIPEPASKPDVENSVPSIEPSETWEDIPEPVTEHSEPCDDIARSVTELSTPYQDIPELVTEPNEDYTLPSSEPSEPCEDGGEPVTELAEPCEDIPEVDVENPVPPTEPSEPFEDIPQPVTELTEPCENIPELGTEHDVENPVPSTALSEPCEDIPELVTEPSEENPGPLSDPSESCEDSGEPITELAEPCEEELINEPNEEYPMPSSELSEPCEDIPQPVSEPAEPCKDIPELITEPDVENSVPTTEPSVPCEDILEPVTEPVEPCEDVPEPSFEPNSGDPVPRPELSEPCENIPEPVTEPSELCEDIPEPVIHPDVETPVPLTKPFGICEDILESVIEPSEPCEGIPEPIAEPHGEYLVPSTEPSEPCEDIVEPVIDPYGGYLVPSAEPSEISPGEASEWCEEKPVEFFERSEVIPEEPTEEYPVPLTESTEHSEKVSQISLEPSGEIVEEPTEPCGDISEPLSDSTEKIFVPPTQPSEISSAAATEFSEGEPEALVEHSEMVPEEPTGIPVQSTPPSEIMSEEATESSEHLPQTIEHSDVVSGELTEPCEGTLEDVCVESEVPISPTDSSEILPKEEDVMIENEPEVLTEPSEPTAEALTEPCEDTVEPFTEASDEIAVSPTEPCEIIPENPTEHWEDTTELLETSTESPLPPTEPSETYTKESPEIMENEPEALEEPPQAISEVPAELCEDNLEPFTEPSEEYYIPPTKPTEIPGKVTEPSEDQPQVPIRPTEEVLEESTESWEDIPEPLTYITKENPVLPINSEMVSGESTETYEYEPQPSIGPSDVVQESTEHWEDLPELLIEPTVESPELPSQRTAMVPEEVIKLSEVEPDAEIGPTKGAPGDPAEEYTVPFTELSKIIPEEGTESWKDEPQTLIESSEVVPQESTKPCEETSTEHSETVLEGAEPAENEPQASVEPSEVVLKRPNEACDDISEPLTSEENPVPSTEPFEMDQGEVIEPPEEDLQTSIEPDEGILEEKPESCEDAPELLTEPCECNSDPESSTASTEVISPSSSDSFYVRPLAMCPHGQGCYNTERYPVSRSLQKSKRRRKPAVRKLDKLAEDIIQELPEVRPTYTPVYDDDNQLVSFVRSDLLADNEKYLPDPNAPVDSSCRTEGQPHILINRPTKVVHDSDGNMFVLPLNPDGSIAYDSESVALKPVPEENGSTSPTGFHFPEVEDFPCPSADPGYIIVRTPDGHINYIPSFAAPGREITLPSGKKFVVPVFPSKFLEPSVPYHAFTTPDGFIHDVPYGRGYGDEVESSMISIEKIETADGSTVEIPVETKKRCDGSITTSVTYSPNGKTKYKTIVDVSGDVYSIPISGSTTHLHPHSKPYKTIIDLKGDEYHVPEGQIKSSAYKTIVDLNGNIYEIPANMEPVDNINQYHNTPATFDSSLPYPELAAVQHNPDLHTAHSFNSKDFFGSYFFPKSCYSTQIPHYDRVMAHIYQDRGLLEQPKPCVSLFDQSETPLTVTPSDYHTPEDVSHYYYPPHPLLYNYRYVPAPHYV